MVTQLFMVKPDSLQATTYYIGVFNMDYYIHQPYSYTLRVRALTPSRQPHSIHATTELALVNRAYTRIAS